MLLLLWQLYTELGEVEEYLLPSPLAVIEALVEDHSLLLKQLATTAGEAGLGLIIATAFGLLVGLAAHRFDSFGQASYPLLVASQAVPVVVIAPLLVTWLGFGLLPKLLIIALICFFPITVTLTDGLRTVDSQRSKLLANIGASRWQRMRMLELPAALPNLFSGIKVAAAVAVIGAVFAEQASSTSGLGRLILQSLPQLETARAFAAVFLLCLLSITLFTVVGLVERAVIPWNFNSKSNSMKGSPRP